MSNHDVASWDQYVEVRSETEALAAPIRSEDAQIQSMPDASPTKWHLGHTTWFFETFLLDGFSGHRIVREEYRVLFNSYYNAVGAQHPRLRRGLITRPSLDEVVDYRHAVDASVRRFLDTASTEELERKAGILTVGLHHEQQHQELIMTDILHVYASNPLKPRYAEDEPPPVAAAEPMRWHAYPEGIYWIGHEGEGFAFDNEYPRHRQFVHAFELASRLVTAGEYMEFMSSGGYQRPELWLSDGWAVVQNERWQAPMYWERRSGTWWQMSLYGLRPVDPNAPLCHVSYYEADAFARWSGVRLPTEAEWEVAASSLPIEGNLSQNGSYRPAGPPRSQNGSGPTQMYGDVWEWTQSAYLPYHGYRPAVGALGEYNGKFMCNQMVLRGGSFATSAKHIRPTYRNFFYPASRWQFLGIRLARDAE
ncbi:MAG TPA: ergothioneine biosynthesis protein EgtB [Vicinamibacteria bacterium]|nr:ergothioneine biosynthesis protein EgtB [Vicinamibacteria bacterium]